jgi:HK97 gp10 family phage protein
MIRVKVFGVEELRANLRALPPDVAKFALTVACRNAADVFRERMLETVPRDEGTLAASLAVQYRKPTKKLSQRYVVGPTRSGFYGSFLEWGTRFITARPWMRPAFAQGAQPALNAANKAVQQFFDRWHPPRPVR